MRGIPLKLFSNYL